MKNSILLASLAMASVFVITACTEKLANVDSQSEKVVVEVPAVEVESSETVTKTDADIAAPVDAESTKESTEVIVKPVNNATGSVNVILNKEIAAETKDLTIEADKKIEEEKTVVNAEDKKSAS